METEMQKVIKHFETELLKIRTGRAHTSLVEDIQVVGYTGTAMSIKQVAVLAAPESRLITIQPWDTSMIDPIEKAILASDTGLTPVNDGKIIGKNLAKEKQRRQRTDPRRAQRI
jgi:ribosome recycling factor